MLLQRGTLPIVYKIASHFLNIVRAKGGTPLKPRTAGSLGALLLMLLVGRGDAMSESKNKTRVVSFRIAEEDIAAYEEKLQNSGVTKSQFFRGILFDSNATFEAPPKSKDFERLLFLYNKSSNNLNQLAHRVNSAYRKSEVISESLYIKAVNELVLIRELLMAGVNHVD